jgi:hypothetical protein
VDFEKSVGLMRTSGVDFDGVLFVLLGKCFLLVDFAFLLIFFLENR